MVITASDSYVSSLFLLKLFSIHGFAFGPTLSPVVPPISVPLNLPVLLTVTFCTGSDGVNEVFGFVSYFIRY